MNSVSLHRSRLAAAALAAATAAVALLAPRPARSCSHPFLPPGPPYLVMPADGATDVPTNVAMTVYGGGCSTDASPFVLRDATGGTVAVTTEPMNVAWGTGYSPTSSCRLRAAAPLTPHTTYDLVFSGTGGGFADAGAPLGIGSFTTGDGSDDTPPPAPTISAASVGERHACGFDPPEACCMSGIPLLTATITVAPAMPGATEPLFYSLREGDTLLAVDLPVLEPGILACDYPYFSYETGPGHLPTWWLQGAVHEVALTTRDLAAHESPPVYVTLAGVCNVQDQGTGALPGRDPGDESASGCGCSAGRAGRGGATLLAPLVLAVLAVLAARRRRRRS